MKSCLARFPDTSCRPTRPPSPNVIACPSAPTRRRSPHRRRLPIHPRPPVLPQHHRRHWKECAFSSTPRTASISERATAAPPLPQGLHESAHCYQRLGHGASPRVMASPAPPPIDASPSSSPAHPPTPTGAAPTPPAPLERMCTSLKSPHRKHFRVRDRCTPSAARTSRKCTLLPTPWTRGIPPGQRRPYTPAPRRRPRQRRGPEAVPQRAPAHRTQIALTRAPPSRQGRRG